MIPDIRILKQTTVYSYSLAILCGLAGLSGLCWAVYSETAWPSLAFFGFLTALTPVAVLLNRRGVRKLLVENNDNEIYRELLNQVNDAIIVIDVVEPYRILEGNRSACERLGYGREELIGMQADAITDIQSALEIFSLKGLRRGNLSEYREMNYKTKAERHVPVEVNIRFVRMKGRLALLAIGRDLSERKHMENRIRHMAYYDDLTGLPNRRLFREQLDKAIAATKANREGLAVFYLDIDRFKLVNDSFGHDYGDILLMQVAERFTRCVRKNDFLARSEGDEFALFYTGIQEKEELDLLADGIRAALEQPFLIGEYQIHITASIGISHLLEGSCENAELIMKYADIALSFSKENGKNNHKVFNSEMNSISLNRLTMESELRRAIKRGEFILMYQPQIDLENGALVGMEALIRWNHPERGLVSPKDFIPIAEETGLIVPIGDWVMFEACKQNKLWQNEGLTAVPVSVNLSMRQFLQHNLKGKIQSVLEDTGLSPEYLELEITESMTMDVDFATRSLLEMKELGVQISIDDFGTGYSSLYLLKKFPIDKLKIDRSFVRDIMVDPNDAAIVTTIISMTHHLNLKVIAEGVETEEQMRFLHENHCNQIQGFWFSPPIPADDFIHILRNNPSFVVS